MHPNLNYQQVFLTLASCWLFFVSLFLVFPGIDILVSDVFYDNARHKFYFKDSKLVLALNTVMGELPRIMLVLLLAATLLKRYVGSGWLHHKPLKDVFLCLAIYAFSAGLLIDRIVKKCFLRPRPHHLSHYGGTEEFFGIFQGLSEGRYHSFVSGHAAGWFGLVCLGLFFDRKHCGQWLYFSLITGLSAGLLRIMIGKHFLSDIIFAGLFVYTSGCLFSLVIQKSRRPKET